jgi:hypothetical protein
MLPPVLLLFGLVGELTGKTRNLLVLAPIGAWLFCLVVFWWNMVVARDLHFHPPLGLALAQVVFAALTVVWVHWRIRRIMKQPPRP